MNGLNKNEMSLKHFVKNIYLLNKIYGYACKVKNVFVVSFFSMKISLLCKHPKNAGNRKCTRKLNIFCVMAIHQRENVTIETIELLKKQTYPLENIILIGDSDIEKNIALKTNCLYKHSDNYPLGSKWQSGIMMAKSFNPDAILICGSDDWLTPNWCEICKDYIDYGYDLVGKNNFFIANILPQEPVVIVQRGYRGFEKLKVPIGAGRLISKKILDAMNWQFFNRKINKGLDRCSYTNTLKKNGNIKLLNEIAELKIMSIKSSWPVLDTFDVLNQKSNLRKYNNINNSKEWLETYFPESIAAIKRIVPDVII
jgi:hypothetical protein